MYRHITEDNKMVLVANDKYWGKMPYISMEIHFLTMKGLNRSNCDLLLTGSNVTRYMNKAGSLQILEDYVCLVPNLRTNNVQWTANIRKALIHY